MRGPQKGLQEAEFPVFSTQSLRDSCAYHAHAELSWLEFSVGSCRCLLAMLYWPNFSVGSCRCPSQQMLHSSRYIILEPLTRMQGLLPAELCWLILDLSGAHARASSCGALVARLFRRFLSLPLRSALLAQLCRQIWSLSMSRCSTTLGPSPGLLTAVAASALTRMQWLLPAELCWRDFSVGSCCCLLAVLCWLNFSVGSCRCPSEQMLCWPNFFVGSCHSLPLVADARQFLAPGLLPAVAA